MSTWMHCFENAFVGNKQMKIMHKFNLGDDVWHICTIDSNDYYHSGYYQFDRENWTFTSVEARAHVPTC
jgi:hypothetical protein